MSPRIIELIRNTAVPSSVMRSAAHGALSLPAGEMIEILVHLTTNPVFADRARLTLAMWDEDSARAVAADPTTPAAVLDYLVAPENLRPGLAAALFENSSVGETKLLEVAHSKNAEVLSRMLMSPRVNSSANILQLLKGNVNLDDKQLAAVNAALVALGESESASDKATAVRSQYEMDHADEILGEEGKPFQLIGDILDLGFDSAGGDKKSNSSPLVLTQVTSALDAHAAKQPSDPAVQGRLTALQRIAKLSVGERVQLAMKGSREDRFILVRDGARVVACAVLVSPKLTDNEVETISSMRNVQEQVLRDIAMNRRFKKNYSVLRSLVNNPRSPIDITLPLLDHLLVNDLKHLIVNKNVNETLRSIAAKKLKAKTLAAAGRRD